MSFNVPTVAGNGENNSNDSLLKLAHNVYMYNHEEGKKDADKG